MKRSLIELAIALVLIVAVSYGAILLIGWLYHAGDPFILGWFG